MVRETFESDLLKQARTIVLEGRVTADEARRIVKQLLLLKADSTAPITLLITSSNGGDVEPALDIFGAIQEERSVDGIVYQQAHSVAALILQACRCRSAYRLANITIHDNEVKMEGTVKMLRKHSEEKLAAAEKRQRMIYEIFAKRGAGRSVEEVEEQCQKGTPLTANEALAFGLIDRVI